MKRMFCLLLSLLTLLGMASASSTLVAYYSRTGHTQAVAVEIAAITGGDLFRIEAAVPYTDEDVNWRNPESRVSLQHDNPELRNIELTAATPEGWADYDTVYLGYPIWYGNASFPVLSFVLQNDFSGKKVIPFCTSTNAALGESALILSRQAGTGDWLPGRRFREKSEEGEVASWLSEVMAGL